MKKVGTVAPSRNKLVYCFMFAVAKIILRGCLRGRLLLSLVARLVGSSPTGVVGPKPINLKSLGLSNDRQLVSDDDLICHPR